MAKKEEERRVSLRIPESLALEIQVSISKNGMTFTEFLRRACREKLQREKDENQLQESESLYLSKKQIEALKHALQLPDVREIILEIVENRIK